MAWFDSVTAVSRFLDHLVELDVKDADRNPVTLRYSRRGFTSGAKTITAINAADTIGPGTHFEKRIDKAPEVTSSMWTGNRLSAGSKQTTSSLSLINEDAGLDKFESLLTINGRWRYFIVDIRDPDNTLYLLGRGTIPKQLAGKDLKRVDATLEGLESVFRGLKTTNKVFRGTGNYMLELDAGDTRAYVGFGSPAGFDITTLTVTFWLHFVSLGTVGSVLFGYRGTQYPWRISVDDTSGQLTVEWTVSGVKQIKASGISLVAGRDYHIAVSIDDEKVKFLVWDDKDSKEYDAEVLHSDARDAASAANVELRAVNSRIFWFDNLTVYDVYLEPQQIRDERFKPFELLGIPDDVFAYYTFNDASGTTVADSAGTSDGTISTAGTGSYAWVRSLAGPASLAGEPKQDTLGICKPFEPRLVDPASQTYMIAGTGNFSGLTCYEGAVVISAVPYPEASDLRTFLKTNPSAGQVLTFPDEGAFKLGSVPALPLMVECTGRSDLGYATNEVPGMIRDVVERSDITDVTVDTNNFTSIAADFYHPVGISLYKPIDVLDLFDRACNSLGLYWSVDYATSKLVLAEFSEPSSVADHVFSSGEVKQVTEIPAETIIHEMVTSYAMHSRRLTPDQIAASARTSDDISDWIDGGKTHRVFENEVLKDFGPPASQVFEVSSLQIGLGNARPGSADVVRPPKGVAEDTARRMALFTREAVARKITLKAAKSIAIKKGDTIGVEYIDRLGRQRLSPTDRWIVVSVTIAIQKAQVSALVFRFKD